MFAPAAVVDVDVARRLEDVKVPAVYEHARVLVRARGTPVGEIVVPLREGTYPSDALAERVAQSLTGPVLAELLHQALQARPFDSWPVDAASLFSIDSPRSAGCDLPVTVAVCTRNRTAHLTACLDGLVALTHEPIERLLIDNAPVDRSTRDLVRARYPTVRYVCEPRPGLDWARNRAILEATHDIIAFTDDDVVVDPGWATAIAAVFADETDVMAVTGLVLPYELETPAQALFERYGGFGRGFRRRWFRVAADHRDDAARLHAGTGKFGTGANMAFRRRLFDAVGAFDCALDVGTVTNGGGDLDMFFRVLREGHALVYEPRALVRHRHRREYAAFRTQIANNGIGFYAYLARNAARYPEARARLIRFGAWWLWWWNLRRPLLALIRGEGLPADVYLAEVKGSLSGAWRGREAQRQCDAIASQFPGEPVAPSPRASAPSRAPRHGRRMGIRTVDVAEPIAPIEDAAEFDAIRVFVFARGNLVGHVDIENLRHEVSAFRLRDAVAAELAARILEESAARAPDSALATWQRALANHLAPRAGPAAPGALASRLTVSVVVATRDRPAALRECLASLVSQRTARRIEVVVVDNNPASGLTAPVVHAFPGVVLVNESRRGLSYARNAGIVRSRGDVIATTDDDVTAPADWIERLVRPLDDPSVMVVTGNVLPRHLENAAERWFEAYGGLSRGYQQRRVDGRWFRRARRSVPTWQLGSTANAAFRASIFADPSIGLMDEALGAGMPTGCSEDTYVFYKVLKAGHAIMYEPRAFVWHRHRADMPALRHQLYNYSKGHVAYHLTTAMRDGDARGLVRLGYELPLAYARRLHARLRGWSDYPLSLLAVELAGTLMGPVALFRARRLVGRLGRSGPFDRAVDERGIVGTTWCISGKSER